MGALLKPKCYFGILCPHCRLPIERKAEKVEKVETADILPFPFLMPPVVAATSATTTNYTTPGSYNYTVPNYNTMTVTVIGAGGGGGAATYYSQQNCAPGCGGGG